MNSILRIFIDGSGEAWAYEIIDALGNSVMFGDGYVSPEVIYQEMSVLSVSLSNAMNNIEVIE